MQSRATAASGMPGNRATGEGTARGFLAIAHRLAGIVHRVKHALAAWRARRRARRRGRNDDWAAAAQERYLRHAADAHDVERRQRTWERDESSAYRVSVWR